MKYIKYKNNSEYTQTELAEQLNPSKPLKLVSLSEENNGRDLLYSAPRFTVLRQGDNGEPVVVNDDQLKVFINKEINSLSDYNTLPSEEYYVIDDLYILKNSGYNKNKKNMRNFIVKYPGYKPVIVRRFDDINNFVLTKETDEFTCQIHMNWTGRDNSANGTSDIDTHVFIYKMNENGELVYQTDTTNREVYYSHKKFSNDDIELELSWDDTTSSNGGKGEYIKIKQKCTDEVYEKYYFVYCLNIYSYQSSWSQEHKLAIWNDVTINITNGINYMTTLYNPKSNINNANKAWCGLLIHKNNISDGTNKFTSSLQSAVSYSEFIVKYTSSNPGSSTPGREYNIILPEFTDELPETPKE
jgi:hypothetical protein